MWNYISRLLAYSILFIPFIALGLPLLFSLLEKQIREQFLKLPPHWKKKKSGKTYLDQLSAERDYKNHKFEDKLYETFMDQYRVFIGE